MVEFLDGFIQRLGYLSTSFDCWCLRLEVVFDMILDRKTHFANSEIISSLFAYLKNMMSRYRPAQIVNLNHST